MSHTYFSRITIIMVFLMFLTACGKTEIPVEDSGSLSEQETPVQMTQDMADRLKLLESQNQITEELAVIPSQDVSSQDIQVPSNSNTIPQEKEETNAVSEVDIKINESISSEENISQTNTSNVETNNVLPSQIEEKNEPIGSQNTAELVVPIAPDPQITQETLTPETVIPVNPEPPVIAIIDPLVAAPVEIITETSPKKEKNIVQKVVDTVVETTKKVVQKVKEIVTPKEKTSGIISSSNDSPTSEQTQTNNNDIIEDVTPDIPDAPDTPENNQQENNNSGSINQEIGNSETFSGNVDTFTGSLEEPIIDEGTGSTDILETSVEIVYEEIDENAGIAQFSQGNFSGLNKSNPINLRTKNNLPIILYEFKIGQIIESPTVIVGKIQKGFVFDGLFGVQIYNSNNDKIKDWYATTFFSQEEGDEEKGMVYFLIELVYDDSTINKTSTGILRFLVDNPTTNTGKDDFIDIPISFDL